MDYNPFKVFKEPDIKVLLENGAKFVVVQRFQWPGIQEGKGFISIPYHTEEKAIHHVSKLEPKEGKIVSLVLPPTEVINLLNSSEYRVFLTSTVTDKIWKNKLLRNYKNKIYSYLRFSTNFKIKSPIEIDVYFDYGRLMANITDGQTNHLTTVYNLIS